MPTFCPAPVYADERTICETSRLRLVVFVDRGTRRRALNMLPTIDPMERAGWKQDRTSSEACEEEAFIGWLFDKAGLDATQYGVQTLSRRIGACLRGLRAGSFGHARTILEAYPSLIAPSISMLVIGVTSFFRDAAVFDDLRERVLPELAGRRSGLRIWSVGCSEGAELYSVAMLLGELGLLGRCELQGTDCRSDTIGRARAGVYDAGSLKGLSTEMLERYFKREASGSSWRIAEPLRRAAQWRTEDALSQQPEAGQWDLILCRNMAMYLKPAAAAGLWQQLESALRPGGVLVLGKAERPVGAQRLAAEAPCIYRREWG
jgi:chemotaxis protein methyltransferase CheR